MTHLRGDWVEAWVEGARSVEHAIFCKQILDHNLNIVSKILTTYSRKKKLEMGSVVENAELMDTNGTEEVGVLRPIFCELSVNNRPDGSAMLTQGDTAVMAAVYGPVEVKQSKILVDRGTVEVVHRPGSGQPRVPDKLIEDFLLKTCEAMILSTSYPRSSLCVITQEIEDSGGLLACVINAACLALLNSGLGMKFPVAAVHSCISSNGEIIIDPNTKQLKDSCAKVTLAFDSISKGTIISHVTGCLSEEKYMEVLLRSQEASDAIFKFYRRIVTKYSPKIE